MSDKNGKDVFFNFSAVKFGLFPAIKTMIKKIGFDLTE